MATNPYEALQQTAGSRGWTPLPAWNEIDEAVRGPARRVLRRLSVANTVSSDAAFGALDVNAGLGEQESLRLFLMLSCLHMLREDAGGVAGVLGGQIDEAMQERIATELWVYRDDPLVAWSPLQAVGLGFEPGADEEMVRLAAARAAWDGLDTPTRLERVAETIEALTEGYLRGESPYPDAPRSVWGDADITRVMRDAAERDSFSLLSDSALDALAEDLPRQTFAGVRVVIDAPECMVRRAAFRERDFDAWLGELAQWDPAGATGETLFAWHAGVGLAVAQARLADHVELWVENALARRIAG